MLVNCERAEPEHRPPVRGQSAGRAEEVTSRVFKERRRGRRGIVCMCSIFKSQTQIKKIITNSIPDLTIECIKNISIYIFIRFYSRVNRMHRRVAAPRLYRLSISGSLSPLPASTSVLLATHYCFFLPVLFSLSFCTQEKVSIQQPH